MRPRARQVLASMVLAAITILVPGAPRAPAQGADSLPAPMPLLPQAETLPAPTPLGLQGGPPAAAMPLPPPAQPPPPPPDLEAPVDPGRDGWGPYGLSSPDPGFYFNTELALIHPVLGAHLANNTPLKPSGDTVTLPSANLNWTVAPWFDLGYRLPRSLGLVSINYRFFTTEGTQAAFLGDQPFALRSRLDENLINLDYGTLPYEFLPHWDFWWRTGVQLADVFFDSRIHGSALDQSASNNFRGAGPHVRLELERHLAGLPGLSLYSRLEGAGDLGRINQNFAERRTSPDGVTTFGTWNQNGIQMVLNVFLEAGLTYVPPGRNNLRFNLGYLYERWFAVGELGDDAQAGVISNAESGGFDTQGFFLRGQVDF
jgi:hypothetical protein